MSVVRVAWQDLVVHVLGQRNANRSTLHELGLLAECIRYAISSIAQIDREQRQTHDPPC